MQELLETIMLICFGLSWPLSLYKNIKSRTAVGMSKPFLLMIILGYAAGIGSKLVAGRINYVLSVYIINISMVLMNLGVYYRNLRLDIKKTEENMSS